MLRDVRHAVYLRRAGGTSVKSRVGFDVGGNSRFCLMTAKNVSAIFW
jgi:hypothetical protein